VEVTYSNWFGSQPASQPILPAPQLSLSITNYPSFQMSFSAYPTRFLSLPPLSWQYTYPVPFFPIHPLLRSTLFAYSPPKAKSPTASRVMRSIDLHTQQHPHLTWRPPARHSVNKKAQQCHDVASSHIFTCPLLFLVCFALPYSHLYKTDPND
jgi:hypothetical protein